MALETHDTRKISSSIAYVYIFVAGLFWSLIWLITASPFGVANLWYAVISIPGLLLVWFGIRGALFRRTFKSEQKWLRTTSITVASLIVVYVLLHLAALELTRVIPPPKP